LPTRPRSFSAQFFRKIFEDMPGYLRDGKAVDDFISLEYRSRVFQPSKEHLIRQGAKIAKFFKEISWKRASPVG